jgi:hypothetical protein
VNASGRGVLAATALLVGGGCAYGPPIWRHRLENAMAEPGGHRFALAVVSTESRRPEGFLATFPDGGAPRVLRERARLWLCDADGGHVTRLAIIERPASFRSEFHLWVVGWEARMDTSAVYVQMSGRTGATSDTPFYRWLFRFEVAPDTGSASAVIFLPNEAARPRGPGPLRGGRELQVSLGADTISVRTDAAPAFRPRFRVDGATGAVVAVGGVREWGG